MFSADGKSIFFYDPCDIFSKKVLENIGVEMHALSESINPTGEIVLRLEDSVRNSKTFLIMSVAKNPNESIMKMLLMVAALKNGAACSITVVIPAMSYVKDDSYIPRSPLAPQLMLRLLETAGADNFVFLDMHSQKQRGYGLKKKDDIKPRSVFAEDMIKRFGDEIILCPLKRNDYSRVEDYKEIIPKLDVVSLNFDGKKFSKSVRNKTIIVVSDLVTNAKRLRETTKLLKKHKAKEVHAYMTHSLFVDDAVRYIDESFLSSLTVSNTLELTDEAILCSKIRVLELDRFFARAVREIDSGESIGKMNN